MPDLEDHDRRLNTEKKELMADTWLEFLSYVTYLEPIPA